MYRHYNTLKKILHTRDTEYLDVTEIDRKEKNLNISNLNVICHVSPVHQVAGFLRLHRQTHRHTDNSRTSRLRDWIGPEGKFSENNEPINDSNLHKLVAAFEAFSKDFEDVYFYIGII